MSIKEEINMAISAHGQWKQKLRTAIETQECESTPTKVKMDNNCSFGKWLYERIEPSIKNTSHYNEVLSLHAQFHQAAGAILELALSGHSDEAKELMKLTGNFSVLSGRLTAKLKNWQTVL